MNSTNRFPNSTNRPWHLSKGSNGFCECWQVSVSTPTHAQTIASCGSVENQVYQGSTENFVGTFENTNSKANAALIVAAVNEYDALCAVVDQLKACELTLSTMQVCDVETVGLLANVKTALSTLATIRKGKL